MHNLLKGIDKHKLIFANLCANPAHEATTYVLSFPDKISWMHLCKNTNDLALYHIKSNVHLLQGAVGWASLSGNSNPMAVDLLINHFPHKINWTYFSANEADEAVAYALTYPDKIVWHSFCSNSNPMAVQHVLSFPQKLVGNNLYYMAKNTHDDAISYVLQHKSVDKTMLSFLQENSNNLAISTIFKHFKQLNEHLSKNTNHIAIEYLLEQPHLINWTYFSENPSIFEEILWM